MLFWVLMPSGKGPKNSRAREFWSSGILKRLRQTISEIAIVTGIIYFRFEMPYSVWCEGCENHIGMGVRYNAEKKKVGMYFTTPIYEFHMKCHLCRNYFTIRTDPQVKKNFCHLSLAKFSFFSISTMKS